MLASFETSFADALLNANRPIPCGIMAHNAAVPARRFGVYRNNVASGLVKALKSRFPVVEKIVGEEFFAAMARVFVIAQPPRSPLLATYGDDFPAFVAAFEPAREIPYLADAARLEAARTRAYHAADATPLGPGHFATLDSQALGDIRIEIHPSTEIVRSPFPIVTIWAMNSGEQELAPIENWRGEDALVARPYLEVQVRALPQGGAAFLLALAAGRPLGAAAEAALADDPDFDLACNLAGLIGSGLVRDIVVPEPESYLQP
ncbi:MAG TPA: DNA-binding domain-containing protein [Bradyrhizobium sp.]